MINIIEKSGSDLNAVYDFFIEADNALKHKNRFSNKNLDKLVAALIGNECCHGSLEKGTMLYRGRIYSERDAATKYYDHSRKVFKGYNRADSFVNLKAPKEGRCNPQLIPYLYVTSSPECSIHEIRPNINEYVSVANIKVLDRVSFINLSLDVLSGDATQSLVPGVYDITVLFYLNEMFSKPTRQSEDYLLSQYIAEKIKNYGFDAIAYRSAAYNGKENICYAIFNYTKCKATSSKLYQVKDVLVSVL